MRSNIRRTLVAGALAAPLALGVPGVAMAGTDEHGHGDTRETTVQDVRGDQDATQEFDQRSDQEQSNDTDQDNRSDTRVNQVNPAINAQDVAGLGAIFGGDSEGRQSIDQDNSVDVENDQDNRNDTDQDQDSDQSAAGEQDQDVRGGDQS